LWISNNNLAPSNSVLLPKPLKLPKALVALPLLSVFQKATHNCLLYLRAKQKESHSSQDGGIFLLEERRLTLIYGKRRHLMGNMWEIFRKMWEIFWKKSEIFVEICEFFLRKEDGDRRWGELSDSKRQFMRFSKSVVESKKGNCWSKKGNCWIKERELLNQKKGEGLDLQIEYVEVYEGGAKNGKFMLYARTRTRV